MTDLKPFDSNGVAEDLAWQRPERRDQAGRVIIFGGANFKLKEVDSYFKAARLLGVGSVHALVPESLAKSFKLGDEYLIPVNFDGYYGLTEDGRRTLQEEFAQADGLIIADIGRSSATEHKIALQISHSLKPVIISATSINLALSYPADLLANPQICLVLDLQSLQKLIKAASLKLDFALASTSSIKSKLSALHQISLQVIAQIILIDDGQILALDNQEFINLPLNLSSQELISHLICWKIWAPKASHLGQIVTASSK